MTTCPNCGSRFLRPAHPRNTKERLDRLRFIDALRCLDCKTRFTTKTFVWADMWFARCPKCRRMDLNSWTGNTYTPEYIWVGFKLQFGALRWRCEYCRLNFSSFRKRKEVFTFSRWQKLGFFEVAEHVADKSPQEGQVERRAGDRRKASGSDASNLPPGQMERRKSERRKSAGEDQSNGKSMGATSGE